MPPPSTLSARKMRFGAGVFALSVIVVAFVQYPRGESMQPWRVDVVFFWAIGWRKDFLKAPTALGARRG